ncbi:MAG: hypothetical protein AAB661_00855 [Patescibacteria group bacterium]
MPSLSDQSAPADDAGQAGDATPAVPEASAPESPATPAPENALEPESSPPNVGGVLDPSEGGGNSEPTIPTQAETEPAPEPMP